MRLLIIYGFFSRNDSGIKESILTNLAYAAFAVIVVRGIFYLRNRNK